MSNHPLRPLRHRAVRLIWGAGVVSDVGTWVQLIIVGSLVAKDSGSALLTGLVALATITPQGLCAPIGGLFADRYDRRKVFVAGLLGQAVITGLLAALLAAGVRAPLVLSAVILGSSAAGALAQPAYSAMLPDLVPPEELMAMVSLGIYSWNSGRIIGPLLATLVAVAMGPAWTVGFNAVTFAVMAIAVASLRQGFFPPAQAPASVRERFVQGGRALRSSRGCRAAIAVVVLLNLFVAAFMGLIPIYARKVFGGGTGLAGTLSALQGVGAIVGSVGVTILAAHVARSRLLTMIVPWVLVAYVAYALAPNRLAAGIAVMCLGAGSSSMFVAGMAVAQRDAPAAERGRVLSLVQTAMGTCYGLGIVWVGFIGDTAGLRPAFLCGAAVLGIAAFVLTRITPDWRSVVDGHAATATRPVEFDSDGLADGEFVAGSGRTLIEPA